ncbi:hypothetical protein EAH_00048650 [Eimeria acervulina]|uniref:Uncharacterized protein n=1 Tax=Eimeria acervulina TaxID=5801 RepID=U6H042_EIMAC|nr:hypothetical protein EAH_00048650 [Eimeria acervulina]CDI84114.1 hypothetical protein EAH_00048650 [Eimeria acervulina]
MAHPWLWKKGTVKYSNERLGARGVGFSLQKVQAGHRRLTNEEDQIVFGARSLHRPIGQRCGSADSGSAFSIQDDFELAVVNRPPQDVERGVHWQWLRTQVSSTARGDGFGLYCGSVGVKL